MNLPIRIILLFLLLLCSEAPSAVAEERPVRVGISGHIPPLVLSDREGGLMVEMIRLAFDAAGHATQILSMTSKRQIPAFEVGMIDVVTGVNPDTQLAAALSHWPVITMRNQAISLRQRNLPIHSVADLGQYRIVAFLNAKHHIGGEFAAMAEGNANYSESLDVPATMLAAGRIDVLISQADIFLYNLRANKAHGLDGADFEFHDLLGPGVSYWFAFRTPELRDHFEQGVAAIYADGRANRMIEEYHQRFGTSRDLFLSLDCRFLEANKPRDCPSGP